MAIVGFLGVALMVDLEKVHPITGWILTGMTFGGLFLMCLDSSLVQWWRTRKRRPP